jgi:RHS repeat-associated protein
VAGGAIVPGSRTGYDPYGAVHYGGALPTDFTFTGQRAEGFGLCDYLARWYDPALGRFISADTVVPEPGNPQGLNRYAYVINNPLRYTDPSGHAACLDEECAWTMHPVEGRVVQRIPTASLPPLLGGYDPDQSVQQAWDLVREWFLETGKPERRFGPESSLTQDVMYDPGTVQFREEWAIAGYPLPWEWHHQRDAREGGLLPLRVIRASLAYAVENVELARATLGFGSKTPEGPIDPVGGVIGSLDTIRVTNAGNGLVRVEVINQMEWRSALRIYGTNYSFGRSVPRSTLGVGGTTVQRFYWWEMGPLVRQEARTRDLHGR